MEADATLITERDDAQGLPPAKYRMRIQAIEWMSSAVVVLTLAPVDGKVMHFRPGQFLNIELPDGAGRSYSMAQAPRKDGRIALHIRLHPNGLMSERLRDKTVDVGHVLEVIGPFGDCVLHPSDDGVDRIIMLATGTGIAPLLAMVEQARAGRRGLPMSLYWGGTTVGDLYLLEHLSKMAEALDWLDFIPVPEKSEPDWCGERGYVQDSAARRHAEFSTARVYACGSPAMVRAARAALVGGRGLDPERFHADSFEFAAHGPGDPTTGEHVSMMVTLANRTQRTVDLALDRSLMVALGEVGLMRGICGGQMSCGTCRIQIDPPGGSQLAPPTRGESRLLSSLEGRSPHDRLACQIAVTWATAGMSIRLPSLPTSAESSALATI
jgi:CDP-4-dehydro-6-deoxyglucose reductase